MTISPILQATLDRYGLSSLSDWASAAIIQGWSEAQLVLEMYKRPEFKTRFAGMFMREQRGYGPVSVDEYLQYERTVNALASTWNMPITKEEIDNLIGNDVSAVEAEQRINIAATAVYDTDAETRQELNRLFGISTGAQMKYWMDPKKEFGNLQQQYRMGEIAGAALRAGYSQQLTASQAQRLAEAGLTRDRAAQGFAQLAASEELFSPINMGENTIDTNTQIEFLAGNADVAKILEERAAKRKAEFEGGGGYAVSQQGFATGTQKTA